MRQAILLPSPLGEILATAQENQLTGVYFSGGRYVPEDWTPGESCQALEQTREWLARYFAGEALPALPPLRLTGTPFCRTVWELLLDIPYGTVITYGQLARQVEERTGRRAAPRSVGQAVGHNPVSILVPCHRVVGAGGTLTGYGGGLERKAWLLRREGISLPDGTDMRLR